MNGTPTQPLRRVFRLFKALAYGFPALLSALRLRRRKGAAVTLYGYYGAADTGPCRNLGDNAILLSMLQAMRRVAAPKLIVVMSKDGAFSGFGEEYLVRGAGWDKLASWPPVIARSAVFVMGGGGMFQDTTGRGGSTVYLAAVNLLFRLAGRRVMWYSMGVGPLRSARARLMAATAARLAHAITVRDRESKDLLVRLKVSPDKVRVTADPVFGLAAPRRETGAAVAGRPAIGISVLPYYEVSELDPDKDAQNALEIRAFLHGLVERGFPVSLLLFENRQDKLMADRILDRTLRKHVKLVGEGCTVSSMLERVSQLDALIGMRFHSVVFGCLCGVPTGAVVTHPKTRALIHRFGLETYSCELQDLTAARLEEMVSALLHDRVELPARIAPLVKREARSLRVNHGVLAGLIEAAGASAA